MTTAQFDWWGVWSEDAGGFLTVEYSTRAHADAELGRLEADDPDDALRVLEVCPDHHDEEQPKDGCEECEPELCEHEVPADECEGCEDPE